METKLMCDDLTLMELFVSTMILKLDSNSVRISESMVGNSTCYKISGQYGAKGIIAKGNNGYWCVNYNSTIVKMIPNELFDIIKPLSVTDNNSILTRYELVKSHYDKMVSENKVFGEKFIFIRAAYAYLQEQINITARFLSNNTSFDRLDKTFCVVSEGLDYNGVCEVKFLDTFYASFIQTGECKSFNVRNCLN